MVSVKIYHHLHYDELSSNCKTLPSSLPKADCSLFTLLYESNLSIFLTRGDKGSSAVYLTSSKTIFKLLHSNIIIVILIFKRVSIIIELMFETEFLSFKNFKPCVAHCAPLHPCLIIRANDREMAGSKNVTPPPPNYQSFQPNFHPVTVNC